MALKREQALAVGLATAGLVWGVHGAITPNVADIRVSPAGDPDLASVERQATAISTALVAGIALLAKDPTVFIIGGATILALAWTKRSANLFDPLTRGIQVPGAPGPMVDGQAVAYV